VAVCTHAPTGGPKHRELLPHRIDHGTTLHSRQTDLFCRFDSPDWNVEASTIRRNRQTAKCQHFLGPQPEEGRLQWRRAVCVMGVRSLYQCEVSRLSSYQFLAYKSSLPSLFHAAEPFQPYSSYLYNLLRVVLVINIGVALWPLLRRKDDLADIALTPAQRKLLGLPASEGPATPGAAYVTPPRYPRSATPQSGSPSNAFNRSTASDKHSATPGSSKTSPFAPSASPLLSRTSGALGSGKRSSFGSPSPLGFGASKGSFFDTPGTPSPSAGKGPSVSLNNKWLWEKGRRSSSDARMLS
jgi:nucleoporin POM34